MTEFRIGQGYDVHQIKEGLPMFLCGIKIPSDRGFVAHSDGDVAIHALCDALLGALALGDIGHLFPDSDLFPDLGRFQDLDLFPDSDLFLTGRPVQRLLLPCLSESL